MDEQFERHIGAYFDAVSGWRAPDRFARLHVLGVRRADALEVVSARIVLDAIGDVPCKAAFRAGDIEAHQLFLGEPGCDIRGVVLALASAKGGEVAGVGRLRLPATEQSGVYVAPPMLLHPDGLHSGSRFTVLSVGGGHVTDILRQPMSDWILRAGDIPYDSVNELASDYDVSSVRGDRALLEVLARPPVEVLTESAVAGTRATVGVILAKSLDRTQAKLGFRLICEGKVVRRGAVVGDELSWSERDLGAVGTLEMEVPAGSVIQCIASYAGDAHHVQWRADPAIFVNPRAAILSLVDPSGSLIQGYSLPEVPGRGRAADDFEVAIGWLLWALGFAVATFGTHPKTRDAFDLVATTPRGDFVLVECTLGLLRADGKLARLAARTVKVRETLAASNLKHVRVLPVIVTAMTRAQVEADCGGAADLGVLVVTREDVDGVQNELVRFPDADALFDRGLAALHETQAGRKNQFVAAK